jgi:hypothetical protein
MRHCLDTVTRESFVRFNEYEEKAIQNVKTRRDRRTLEGDRESEVGAIGRLQWWVL